MVLSSLLWKLAIQDWGEKGKYVCGGGKLEIAKGPFDSIKRPFCLTAEVIVRVW